MPAEWVFMHVLEIKRMGKMKPSITGVMFGAFCDKVQDSDELNRI